VRGKTVIVVDDMIDTGGTLRVAEQVLRREGATDFYVLSTHGIFSAGAYDVIRSLDRSFLRAVVVSNSIPQDESKRQLNKEGEEDVLHVIDVSGVIAEYIRRHHYRESVSVLSQFMPVRDIVRPSRKSTVNQAAAAAALLANADAVITADASPDVEPADEASERLADLIVGEEGGLPVPLEGTPGVLDLDDDNDEVVVEAEVVAPANADDGEEDEDNDVVDDQAPMTERESRRLRNLRKGFRLSSVCWEDRP